MEVVVVVARDPDARQSCVSVCLFWCVPGGPGYNWVTITAPPTCVLVEIMLLIFSRLGATRENGSRTRGVTWLAVSQPNTQLKAPESK